MKRLIVAVLFLLFVCPVLKSGEFAKRFESIKKTATPAELYSFLYALPKGGDIHNHLPGSARSEWWYELATNPKLNGGDTFYTRVKFSTTPDTSDDLILFANIREYKYRQLPPQVQSDYVRLDLLSPELKIAWLSSLRIDRPDEGRVEFFSHHFQRLGQLSQNPQVQIENLVWNMRAFGAEKLRYLETQISVSNFFTNDGKPFPSKAFASLLRERLAQPDVIATGVTARFQVLIVRFLPNAEEQLEREYKFVSENRDLFVGINMAGIEDNGFGYPLRFLEKYRELRRTYPTLPLSIHAGECDGPDHHIRDTLLLGASRIGHGVNLLKDPNTYLLMRGNRWLVECNLISNRLLQYTPNLKVHPFPELLRTDVPVCLNTDDRGMWDSNLTDEYYTAVTLFDLSWDELVKIGRNSLSYSFAEPELKAKLLAEYDRAVQQFEVQYMPENSLSLLKDVTPVTYGYGKRNWKFSFAE